MGDRLADKGVLVILRSFLYNKTSPHENKQKKGQPTADRDPATLRALVVKIRGQWIWSPFETARLAAGHPYSSDLSVNKHYTAPMVKTDNPAYTSHTYKNCCFERISGSRFQICF